MANFQGKVSDELYDRLEQLKSEAGGTHAEFLERMANAYELHKVRQGDNLLSAEVEELESLTARINRLMINANEKINSALRDKDLSYEEKQSANEELIARLRADLETSKATASEMKKALEEANKSNADLSEKLAEAEEQSTLTKELVAEYKNKNDMLLSDLAEYKQDRETNKQLAIEIATLKEQLLEAQNQATTEAQKVVVLEEAAKKSEEEHQEKLANTEQTYIDKITSLKDKHRQALDHSEAMKNVAIKEARADAKEEAQAKLEEARSISEELRLKIDNMQETIATYTVTDAAKDRELEKLKKEVLALQEELEKTKATMEKKTIKKKSKKEEASVTYNPDNITIDEVEIKQ